MSVSPTYQHRPEDVPTKGRPKQQAEVLKIHPLAVLIPGIDEHDAIPPEWVQESRSRRMLGPDGEPTQEIIDLGVSLLNDQITPVLIYVFGSGEGKAFVIQAGRRRAFALRVQYARMEAELREKGLPEQSVQDTLNAKIPLLQYIQSSRLDQSAIEAMEIENGSRRQLDILELSEALKGLLTSSFHSKKEAFEFFRRTHRAPSGRPYTLAYIKSEIQPICQLSPLVQDAFRRGALFPSSLPRIAKKAGHRSHDKLVGPLLHKKGWGAWDSSNNTFTWGESTDLTAVSDSMIKKAIEGKKVSAKRYSTTSIRRLSQSLNSDDAPAGLREAVFGAFEEEGIDAEEIEDFTDTTMDFLSMFSAAIEAGPDGGVPVCVDGEDNAALLRAIFFATQAAMAKASETRKRSKKSVEEESEPAEVLEEGVLESETPKESTPALPQINSDLLEEIGNEDESEVPPEADDANETPEINPEDEMEVLSNEE